ncbi:MAG TPA: hemerythrin domain-containing protein [Mycobacteriales bacterium]|jgi:hemerythrin-like domain-containing protein|nr:hemerythrin domain-containing protein [Mycobacteriales bacterium]
MSPDTQNRPTVDTGEMVVVHKVFRREFRLMPALVQSVAPGDTTRAARVGDHLLGLVGALHAHHTGEDELLWPLLQERAVLQRALVDRMERQHANVGLLLAELTDLHRRWVAAADADVRDALADVAARLSSGLDEHLRDEEDLLLPLVAVHVTQAEWNALGERGRAHLPKGRLAMVFLGAILEDATPQERRDFLAHLPLAARLVWRLVGHRVWAREVADLRGPTAPGSRAPGRPAGPSA